MPIFNPADPDMCRNPLPPFAWRALFAGDQTTTHRQGSALNALPDHPAQSQQARQHLRDCPALIPLPAQSGITRLLRRFDHIERAAGEPTRVDALLMRSMARLPVQSG